MSCWTPRGMLRGPQLNREAIPLDPARICSGSAAKKIEFQRNSDDGQETTRNGAEKEDRQPHLRMIDHTIRR